MVLMQSLGSRGALCNRLGAKSGSVSSTGLRVKGLQEPGGKLPRSLQVAIHCKKRPVRRLFKLLPDIEDDEDRSCWLEIAGELKEEAEDDLSGWFRYAAACLIAIPVAEQCGVHFFDVTMTPSDIAQVYADILLVVAYINAGRLVLSHCILRHVEKS